METPRTNKNAGYYCGHGIKKNSDLVIDPNGPFVLADFARELERENSRLRCAIQTAIDYAIVSDETGRVMLTDLGSTEPWNGNEIMEIPCIYI